MNYSESLFTFPRIAYASMDIEYADKLREDMNIEEDVEYCILTTKIPLDEIIAWGATFVRGVTARTVNAEGAQNTLIYTKTLGEYISEWNVQKFEKHFNAHEQKITEYMKTTLKEAADQGKLLIEIKE